MSIILIDDVLFNDNDEQRKIRYNNCIFFLVLNGISIFSGLFYLYFYFIIPYYQNVSNSLALFLNIFHLITNFFYFLIFFEFYLYEPLILSVTIKIITMFNPLIILCIYYWSACLTHNLYVTYYNYTHNMDKRIKSYKYLLFIILIIFYIYTLLNIHYNDSQILSKRFTFISNYNISFLDFFYICGSFIIIYIIIKLYYVINKKEDFVSVHEYQENEERNQKIKYIFNSVISRNISFVIYFLITFTPTNIVMIIKYILGKSNIHCYLIDYLVIMLISFHGTFLFIVRLFDPLMRNFIINLLLFNREFITNYKEYLLKEKRYNESLTEESILNLHEETDNESFFESKIKLGDYKKNNSVNKNYKIMKTLSTEKINDFEKKKYDNMPNKKFTFTPSLINNNSNNSGKFEMTIINNSKNNSGLNKNGEFNFLTHKIDNENEKRNNSSLIKSSIPSGMQSMKSISKKNEKENKKQNGDNNNKKNIKYISLIDSEDKNKNNSYFHINSSESFDKENSVNIKKHRSRKRSHSICHTQSYDQNIVKRANRFLSKNKEILFIKNFKNNRYLNNKKEIDLRANSTTSHLLKKRILPTGTQKRRCISKTSDNFYHEEISSFALMNYHLEINENLLRMIAISISVNECRIYDDIKVYKKYYSRSIPWKNTNFYKETTLFKEYTDETLPIWLGIKDDLRFTNIQFKIMSYCPFVFHHIRLIDNISIDSMLLSLDPINNIKKIKEMKVFGGRGNNSLTTTWDKKLIVKTINEEERQILIDQMIMDYHCLMKESKSILSRIYGIFRIELRDKGSINVIVQRNMNDLPLETKLLTFDFKGSTVDRQTIEKDDVNLDKEKIIKKYRNRVLKDIDLGIINMKFMIDSDKREMLTSIIDSDSLFLQNLEITDYSLIVFVHKYRKEDLFNNNCPRIIESKDRKYIYNFSIVDFLGTFNLEKKGEKLAKSLVGYIKKLKDTNFSVLEPYGYAKRFRNFCKKIIIDE